MQDSKKKGVTSEMIVKNKKKLTHSIHIFYHPQVRLGPQLTLKEFNMYIKLVNFF